MANWWEDDSLYAPTSAQPRAMPDPAPTRPGDDWWNDDSLYQAPDFSNVESSAQSRQYRSLPGGDVPRVELIDPSATPVPDDTLPQDTGLLRLLRQGVNDVNDQSSRLRDAAEDASIASGLATTAAFEDTRRLANLAGAGVSVLAGENPDSWFENVQDAGARAKRTREVAQGLSMPGAVAGEVAGVLPMLGLGRAAPVAETAATGLQRATRAILDGLAPATAIAEQQSAALAADAVDAGATGEEAQRLFAAGVPINTAANLIPVSAPGRLATRAVTGAGLGAGANVAADYALHEVSPNYTPGVTAESATVGGAMGGIMAAGFGARAPTAAQQAGRLVDQVERSANRVHTPETAAIDEGRAAASRIFAEAGVDATPAVPRNPTATPAPAPVPIPEAVPRPQQASLPANAVRAAELEAKPELNLFEREELELLRQPQVMRSLREAPSTEGIEVAELPADTARPALVRDPVVDGYQALARNPEFFRTQPLQGRSMPELAREAGTTYTGRSEENGVPFHSVAIEQPNGRTYEARVYDDGRDVWLDASRLESGSGAGDRAYNLAYSYARNNGRSFIEDPAGLSDSAMYRRPVQQASAMLKSGDARAIEPGDYLATQRPGGPETRPIARTTRFEPAVRENLSATADNTTRAVPEVADVRFDPRQRDFVSRRTGERVDDAAFDDMAAMRRQQPVPESMVRVGDERAPAPVGRNTLKQAALTNTLRDASPQDRQAIVDALGDMAGSDLGPLGRVMPSKRQTPDQVTQTKRQAEDAVAGFWGRGAVNRLKNRARVEFVTKQEVIDQKLGGHHSESQLDRVDGFFDPATGKAYIVADSGADPKSMPGVLSHEILHANAEQFLGADGMKRLKSSVSRLRNREGDIQKAYAKVPKDTPTKHVDEEALAYLAQDAPNHRFSKMLADETKLFLNRMGVPLDWLNANAAAVRKVAALNLMDAGRRDSVAQFGDSGIRYQKMFHGSPERIESIREDGRFGGVFATGDKSAALSHGRSLHEMDVPDEKILRQYEISYEIPYPDQVSALKKAMPWLSDEDVDAAYVAVMEDRPSSLSDEELTRIFREEDVGQAEWEAQRIRGNVAKSLGYQAVEVKDEHGTSYLVLPGADISMADPDIRYSRRGDEARDGLPKFNSASELWTNYVGAPVFNALSWAVKKVLAADILKRNFINLIQDMPPEARDAWRAYRQHLGELQRTVAGIGEEAAKMTPNERVMVSDYIEREMKAGVTPPENVERIATLMTSIMRKQSDELVKLGMLSEESKNRWDGKYLPRFYERHLLNAPFSRELRKLFVQDTIKGITGKHLKGRGLFERVDSTDVPKYERMGWEVRQPSGKASRSGEKVMMWRDFSPEEREKMGEVRDAMFRFARGYTDTQIDLARGRLFEHIAKTVARDEDPGGSYVFVPDTTIPETGVKKFGALAGKWVPGDVLSNLKAKSGPDNAITKAYLKALSMWKEGKTALNPVAHINNTVSNVVMADLAGVNLADPRSWKLYADTFSDFRRQGASYKEAQRAGLFGGEWYGNEVGQWVPLPSELKDAGNDASIAAKFADKALALAQKGREAMGRAYQAEDQFFKLLLYKQGRQRGLDPDDAVTWAERFVFDYSDTAPGVDKLRKSFYPFISYIAKAAPALAFAATHYPWRIAKWIGLLGGYNMYAFNALYGDDAEKMKEAEEKLLPEFMRGMSSFFGVPKALRLPFNDESTDAGVYLDISRFLPLGDLFDTNNQMDGIPLPAPLTPNNPLLTTAYAMFANKDSFTGKDVVRISDTPSEAAMKRLSLLYRQMAPNNPVVPGTYNFNRLADAAAAAYGEPIGPYTGLDYTGSTISPARALAQTFGFKLRTVDFEREQGWQMSDLEREMRDLKSQKTSLKRNQSISDDTRDRELDNLDEKIEALKERMDALQDVTTP